MVDEAELAARKQVLLNDHYIAELTRQLFEEYERDQARANVYFD